MKRLLKVLIVIGISIWHQSCMVPAQTSTKLSARLTSPVESDSLIYSDNDIGIVFAFSSTEISFIIKNHSNNTLRIVWDESAVVIDGMTQRVGHKNVKYTDIAGPHPPTIIPAGAASSDILIPAENVSYNTTTGWTTKGMFNKPNGLYKVGVLLGLTVNGSFKEYYFLFDVSYSQSFLKVNGGLSNYSTIQLVNTYENLYTARSSKPVIQTWNLIHAMLKEKGFKVESENEANYLIMASNDKLKNSYTAEKSKGQLVTYDKYVVVSRCYSKSKDTYAPVTDLKGTWKILIKQDSKGVYVETGMDSYSITRKTPEGYICTDAEVRSTGVFEKLIADKLK